jgi:hypothetical protein
VSCQSWNPADNKPQWTIHATEGTNGVNPDEGSGGIVPALTALGVFTKRTYVGADYQQDASYKEKAGDTQDVRAVFQSRAISGNPTLNSHVLQN